jgi:hypothetical protein
LSGPTGNERSCVKISYATDTRPMSILHHSGASQFGFERLRAVR